MWPLNNALGRLILQYLTLFCIVPGAMQQVCFPSGLTISCIACIYCLPLVSAARLGVRRQGGFFSLLFPAMTGTVGVYPRWSCRSVSAFVDFFCDFHYFKEF